MKLIPPETYSDKYQQYQASCKSAHVHDHCAGKYTLRRQQGQPGQGEDQAQGRRQRALMEADNGHRAQIDARRRGYRVIRAVEEG